MIIGTPGTALDSCRSLLLYCLISTLQWILYLHGQIKIELTTIRHFRENLVEDEDQ
jgi:hypothetical protein